VESAPAHSPARRRALLAAALLVAVLVTAGCGAGYVSVSADRQNGKTRFVAKCGSCHTLADAGTTGKVGPNLDDAFRQALLDGMTEATVRQVVRDQIAYSIDKTSTGAPGMPKNLVTGQDADDVAAYVSTAVAKGGTGGTTTTAAPPPAPTPQPGGGGSGGNSAKVAAGKKVFASAACGGCHTLKDAGSGGNIGPDLDQLKPSKERVVKQVTNGGGAMPSFKDQLTQEQIDAVAEYVSTVAGK
jgi:mono/diheme cytochrome c family protein